MTMRVMSWDVETSIGKTCHSGTFRDPENDVYTQIWATHPDHVEVMHNPKGFKRTLMPRISDVDILVGHNLSFDLCYVWSNKKVQDFVAHGGVIWDTQLAEYLLTAQQHTTSSLAELQEKYLGQKEKPSRITALFKKGIGADKILAAKTRCPRLFDLYDFYCRTDGSTPLKIFKKQYIRAKNEGMLELIQMYQDYLLAIINMTCTGIKIDVRRTEELKREYNIKHLEYMQQAQAILKSVWTDSRLPEFNVNSPDHKSAVLFGGEIKVKETLQDGYFKNGNPRYRKQESFVSVEGWGVSTALTRPAAKTGFYSTDDKVLQAIAENSDNKDVLEYCKLQKLAMKFKKASKTYLQAFIDRSVDDYLYPNFNSTITPTGRLTSSEPNMQNIPAKSDLSSDIMGLLVAPEGWTCVSIDFSQLEKWVQAYVSGDEHLKQVLLDGKCLHCIALAEQEGETYEYVYQKAKIDEDPVWDAKRTAIKPVSFLRDYGGMEARVAKETGLPLDVVQRSYEVDRELYPQKYRFFEETLPAIVKQSATHSLGTNIAASKKKGKEGSRFLGNVELLPIFDKMGNVCYNNQELRFVGFLQTNYGKKYHFTDNGRIDRKGNLRRSFSLPKFKNYPNQGGGADIQGATTAELTRALITKADKIKMINEIHDSKMFYVRQDVLAPCLKYLKETIENVPAIFKKRFNIDVPFKFPVEIKTGDNFGDMQKHII